MKNKIISILFLLLFFFGNANGQDIRFSYSVATDGATSTVSVFMEKINAGAESVGGLTVDFYYNNAETTLSSWNTAPLTNLGWNVFLTTTNHQADSNPTVPITHTGYGEISVIDQNTVGTALTTASGQVHILDIVFDNAVGTPNFGGDGFLASTSNNRPPLKYTDPSASNQFDVIATGSQAQALPVELVFFEARAFEKHIALSWQSETETAFSGYELQRSTDGARFSKLVFMNAKGDGLAQAYQYQDEDVRPGITYYYRLKMIDINGDFDFSPLRSAKIEGDVFEGLDISPNPAKGHTFIKFNAPREGDYILQLINEKGGMVYQKNYQLNEGKNSILLNAARFPRGIYFIKIKMGGAVVSGKLVLAGE